MVVFNLLGRTIFNGNIYIAETLTSLWRLVPQRLVTSEYTLCVVLL